MSILKLRSHIFLFILPLVLTGLCSCQPPAPHSFTLNINAYSDHADSTTMQIKVIALLQKEISQMRPEGLQKIAAQAQKGKGQIRLEFYGTINEKETVIKVHYITSVAAAKLPEGVMVTVDEVKSSPVKNF